MYNFPPITVLIEILARSGSAPSYEMHSLQSCSFGSLATNDLEEHLVETSLQRVLSHLGPNTTCRRC